jgi:pimeloyl-ACP methyl ester carboxylesterase
MARLELEGIALHYDQFGHGPDILWVSGGGGGGSLWHPWQIPDFEADFRNTTFDNRGVGKTVCEIPPPWTIADMARDAAALIERVCDPPVGAVGLRGRAAKAGGRLDGMFAVTHYAAQLHPARVLGDPEAWERIKTAFLTSSFLEDNEESLIPQWQACIDFDVVDRLPSCQVPLHVFAFNEDVQAPPQYGEEVADLAPKGELHLFEGMGHRAIRGDAHDVLNPLIREIVGRYL